MIKIVKYSEEYKEEWDNFIRDSKNGVFFFLRDYVEYHADRFTDCSLMFYVGNRLWAVMPGNIENDIFYSHRGLSFGGMVLAQSITTISTVNLFLKFLEMMKGEGISKIIYKCIPYIYHLYPSEEDLFSLFQADAVLTKRLPSAVISMKDRLSFQTLRKRGIKKATKENIVIEKTNDYKSFWIILTANLKDRYKVNPTHSLDEILFLKRKFPDNIHLFGSFKENEMLGGVVVFINKGVVRAQYISTFPEGRISCALDRLFDYLINIYYRDAKYFDFGVSTETYLVNDKLVLNENLLFQKEGFGARSIMYDTYEINMEEYNG